jgi:hypothetical protein
VSRRRNRSASELNGGRWRTRPKFVCRQCGEPCDPNRPAAHDACVAAALAAGGGAAAAPPGREGRPR